MDRPDPPRRSPRPLAASGPAQARAESLSDVFDPWRLRDEAHLAGADLVGYRVEATDGEIGKIDSTSYDVRESYLVVDTGPWIFGRRVLLPIGTVRHVDHDAGRVYVNRSRDQVRSAQEYDEEHDINSAYRDKLGD